MIYFCCDKRRQNEVRGRSDTNGIDNVEVIDHNAASEELRQRLLRVHLLNAAPDGFSLTTDNVRIEGGERVKNIKVVSVAVGSDNEADVLSVEVDKPGDFSNYTLRLLRSDLNKDIRPLPSFDPILSSIEFSFKVECPSEFDCKPKRICPPEIKAKPQIDYLAKDYASFRRLMLDRLAVLIPDWQERHAADLGMTLVELLAYVGDHLSYEQDAVATEAYLGTCRSRISARRHARLVDYFINDGCNSRTWVQIQAGAQVVIPAKTQLTTRLPIQGVVISEVNLELMKKADAVFETMHSIELFPLHNRMLFYTWSDARCCLPAGATRATLMGHFPNLRAHDVLVFEEVLGPATGNAADADVRHRHPVLLTSVIAFDEEGNRLVDPVSVTVANTGTEITEIEWADEDALPYAFCISSQFVENGVTHEVPNASVVRGNIVLADHGRTVIEPEWKPVPEPKLKYATEQAADRCASPNSQWIPSRFNPLIEGPVTQAAQLLPLKSARAAMRWEQKEVLPDIKLISNQTGEAEWIPKRDLLNSEEDKEHFVAEVESDGSTYLRFGDDKHGKRPNAGIIFTPVYRIGNGTAGNIGIDSLVHIFNVEGIAGVRNLTPGQGGVDPESIEDIRQRAPFAFRTQKRAVTTKDYEDVTGRHPGVQQAAATYRWTGSWYTWFLTVDRKGGLEVDKDFETEIRAHVEPFRMAGYDLEIDAPSFVPLEIEAFVCVKPDYFRSDVKEALLTVFSNQRLANGRLGVFHPDNFTFGQTVYLSPLYAKAKAVPGVASVQFKTFQRQRFPDRTPLQTGELPMNRLEIARLDNNRNFPELGVFCLELGGGK